MTEAIVTKMNYVLELIALLIFCLVVYICAFLNRGKYVKVLNMINSTWCDLPINNNSQNILSNLKFHVNFIVMGSLFTVVIIQFSVNFSRNSTVWKMILVALTFNLPQTIEFTALAFYYSLVMMLVAILANINEHCVKLTMNKTIILSELTEVKSKSAVTLRQMELAYVKAFQIKTYINKAFQGPILACTLQCFHSIVSESHIIYHGVVVGNTVSSHDVINCSIWIAYQIFKIYCLSYAGNLLKLEALKIGQTLHNIPTEKQDLRWLMEIQHFSSLMTYQKIEMTVYEYFPLDATLLYNMLASAMMYLIILVQFDRRE
ncbi:putative gustatory receptor 59f [Nymphalis io]|uniref:putative gustatory receptor 59f n=1 Tax=Inachis io TaxID=171585 RepID=UPI002168E37B|nr:putative gustatory receptor 59f [Nymphalis io]